MILNAIKLIFKKTFSSIQAKIAIPVIGILFALVLFIVLYVSYSLENFTDERSGERLQMSAQSAQAYIEQLERHNRVSSRVISYREDIISLVRQWNDGKSDNIREALITRLETAAEETSEAQFIVNHFIITDINGDVILRTADLGNYNYDIRVAPIIHAAHEGRVETVYAQTDFLPMGICSSAPIRHDGEIIGTVTTVLDLSSLDFVDELGEIFNAEVTVFADDESVASTLYLDSRKSVRAVGTTAHPQVAENVLMQGLPYDVELELFGAMHHAFYFPLFGWENQPVGMFFIGFSIEDAADNTNAFIRNLILLSLLGLVVTAAVMFFGINWNMVKVKNLARTVENITNGGEWSELSKIRVSSDEVGILSRSVITMVETIRKLSSDRSIPEIKQHIDEIERNALESEAANKAKTEFLSRMSHEIRTPMGAILGITEIQLRSTIGETREAFEKIYASGDMLLGLINDILDLSKIESGKMELFVEKYDVAGMIIDTAQLNMMMIGTKPLRFEVTVNDSIPTHLFGDELRIKQILNNVLSNAFKYTNEGAVKLSVGKVSYSPDELNLVFTISDTGQGMTPEQVHGIFDEFTRFNHASNLEIEGAGLGMSIVKNLLNMMHGKISVVSEPGMGSIFTIHIPQKIAEKSMLGKEIVENIKKLKPIEHKKSIQTEWESMPYGKVMVVDDTYMNLYVTKGLLAPYELQADFMDSGYAAIEKITSGSTYDLILMDHMMPQMDGIETVRRLRQMGYTAPIVAFSANAIVGQEETFLDKGFDDFVSKPIQSTHLNSILYKYVHNSHVKSHRISPENISKTQIDHNELCKEFARSQKNVIVDMKRAIRVNDYSTAQLLAHTLRSLAGLIGETKLMQFAIEAESAFRKKRLPIDTLNSLTVEVENVISAINQISSHEPKIPPPSEAEKKILFSTLATLLSQHNTEAITLIPTLEAIPNTEEIISNIENFNFSLALKNLEKLKSP